VTTVGFTRQVNVDNATKTCCDKKSNSSETASCFSTKFSIVDLSPVILQNIMSFCPSANRNGKAFNKKYDSASCQPAAHASPLWFLRFTNKSSAIY